MRNVVRITRTHKQHSWFHSMLYNTQPTFQMTNPHRHASDNISVACGGNPESRVTSILDHNQWQNCDVRIVVLRRIADSVGFALGSSNLSRRATLLPSDALHSRVLSTDLLHYTPYCNVDRDSFSDSSCCVFSSLVFSYS